MSIPLKYTYPCWVCKIPTRIGTCYCRANKEMANELVSLLLKHPDIKKIINEKNYDGKHPVMLAQEQGLIEVVELLVKNGAEINKLKRKVKHEYDTSD